MSSGESVAASSTATQTKTNTNEAALSVDQQIMIKSQRCLLYNRLVELMPDQIQCQPKGDLSDLVQLT